MTEQSQPISVAINEEVKLTEWANEPSVAELKQNLDDASQEHARQINKIEQWLDNLAGYQPELQKLPKNRSKVVPKLIRKQAEWRYAALTEPFLSTEDIFNVNPVTYADKEAAIQNELVLNNQFNTKINKVSFIDEYVRTAVDEGTVIVRVGWDYEEETITTDQNIPTDPTQPFTNLYDSPFTETAEIKITRVVKNQPTVEVCNVRDIIIDPTCKGDIEKAEFIIYRFETSLSELRKDGRYTNLDQINLDDNSPLATPDTEYTSDFTFKDDPRKKIIAYEYWGFWDIDNNGIAEPIVATFVGNTIIRMEENPFPDKKLPFVIVPYLPVRKSIYGEPDGELLADNQKIIGAVTRGMIDLMGRSANAQKGVRKDALDLTNLRKFERGEDFKFNTQVDPNSAFWMGKFPEIPRSAMEMLQLQNADAESLTGVKAFHNGISGQALGSTATGIRSAMDAASKRELGILRRLAKGIEEIGRKIIAMNAEFLSEEEVIRITDEEFVTVKRDDLAGNFDLKLSISTAEADNEKAQELAFMLQTMGNNMDPEMGRMILADIARLRKMPALAKKIESYQPQVNPLVQKQQELQIALLEAQVMNERNKALENQTDVELKRAKTQSELAKARSTHSKADKEDLEFVERQSGVDLQKELIKKEQERKAQLDLKAADRLFNSKKENT